MKNKLVARVLFTSYSTTFSVGDHENTLIGGRLAVLYWLKGILSDSGSIHHTVVRGLLDLAEQYPKEEAWEAIQAYLLGMLYRNEVIYLIGPYDFSEVSQVVRELEAELIKTPTLET